jgi:DHA1 family multidrug resistance protein-like MFS transporter
LRKLTGRTDLKSESEIRLAKISPRHIAFDVLIKPFEINIFDPAVLFTAVYTALVYGLYYSFFESFPLVYRNIYGFNLGQLGLTFLSGLIGLIVGVSMYCAYFYYVGDSKIRKMEIIPPERSPLALTCRELLYSDGLVYL